MLGICRVAYRKLPVPAFLKLAADSRLHGCAEMRTTSVVAFVCQCCAVGMHASNCNDGPAIAAVVVQPLIFVMLSDSCVGKQGLEVSVNT